jgi:RimJ/RimL family protein N-acetyltransferase
MDDVKSIVAIDSDSRTNLHRRGGAPSPGQNVQTSGEFVRGWEEHDVGYWIVEFGGDVIGMAGVEPQLFLERECWNLCYRLCPSAWGNGFAVEAVKEAVTVASTLQPTWSVVARTRATNYAAARTADNAGLRRRPELDTSGFEVFAIGW